MNVREVHCEEKQSGNRFDLKISHYTLPFYIYHHNSCSLFTTATIILVYKEYFT